MTQQIAPNGGAQPLIADGGYFGVKQTSDRFVDFAVSAFGRVWAEISQKTYEAIMGKLDTFAAGFDQ
ncbi:MAG: hypothetical protein K0A94_11400 [Desulfuromonadales bacterium]|nr:hypothetical protein [Desulfuromonadales bacterium]